MGEGIKLGGGSVGVLNAIIEDYLALDGIVSANSFVEFVGKVTEAASVTTNVETNGWIGADKIDDEKVFVAYNYDNNTSDPFQLYGVIVTIAQNGSITYGSPKAIVGTASDYSYTYISVCKVDKNHVFVAYNEATSSVYPWYALCEISNDDFTVTKKAQVSASYIFIAVGLKRIEDGRLLYVYYNTTSQAIHARIITVNGTNVTYGSAVTIFSGSVSYYSVAQLSKEKFLLVNSYSVSGIRGTVIEVSGTSITKGTTVDLDSTATAVGYMSCEGTGENGAFVAYGYNNASVRFLLLSISGNTITVTSAVDPIKVQPGSVATFSITDSLKIVMYLRQTQLNVALCKVLKGSMSVLSEYQFFSNTSASGASLGAITTKGALMQSGILFCTRRLSSGDKLGFFALDCKEGVRLAEGKIEGLTKTSASTIKPGKVWLLA